MMAVRLKVPRVALPKVRLSPKRTLQKQYHNANTVLYFLVNQVLPSRRSKAALPQQYATLEGVRLECNAPIKDVPQVLPDTFSFATWNIEMGYQQEALQRDLPTIKSDIILLQEVPVFTTESAPLLAEYGTYYAYAPGLFIGKHSAKYAFSHRGQLTLCHCTPLAVDMIQLPAVALMNPDTDKDKFGRRVALYTKLQTARGTLGIYNVHLENYSTPPGRRMQLQEIFNHMTAQKDHYVIMAGDLNNIYGRLELLGISKQTGLSRAKTGRTCRLFALDHIFHSSNIKISAKVVHKKSSDHSPLVAQVTLL